MNVLQQAIKLTFLKQNKKTDQGGVQNTTLPSFKSHMIAKRSKQKNKQNQPKIYGKASYNSIKSRTASATSHKHM